MGCAVPYALAAKLAHTDRPVVALAGDGAMQMNGLAELITVARHAPAWSDPRFVVLVLNNRDLSQVTWEQRLVNSVPRYDASQALPDVRFAEHARLLGLEGIRVERPDDVGPAWDRALACGRPAVLESSPIPTCRRCRRT